MVPPHRRLSGQAGLLLLLALTFMALNAQDARLPYQDPNLAVDVRVADLLGRMTLDEKTRQLDMYFGCESVLNTNLETHQLASKTHADPNATFDPQLAEKNLG